MKSLPGSGAGTFTGAKNTASGARPVWFLAVSDGTTTYYLSDRVVSVQNSAGASVTTLAWVASWGELREGVTNSIGEYSLAELRVRLLNDPTDPSNIVHIIDNHNIEAYPVEMCLWFEGISDPARPLFRGYVRDVAISANDAAVELLLQDMTLRSDNLIGVVATKTLLGGAMADRDVGKILPIVFGTVSKVPCIGAVVPFRTTLTQSATVSDTQIAVSDASQISAGELVQIDAEIVAVSAVSGQTLTVTRGQQSTTAATHDKGAVAVEYKSGSDNFTYLAAGHPLTGISRVWARIGEEFHDITSLTHNRILANGWSGQNWATITMPGAISVQQLTDLGLTGIIRALETLHSHTTGGTNNTATQNASTVSAMVSTVVPAFTTSETYKQVCSTVFTNPGGTVTICSHTVTVTCNWPWMLTIDGTVIYSHPGGSSSSFAVTVADTSQNGTTRNGLTLALHAMLPANPNSWPTTYSGISGTLTSASRSITYILAGTVTTPASANVSLQNTLTLSGSQIATTIYENGIFADCANSAANTPKQACEWLLTNVVTWVSSLVAAVTAGATTLPVLALPSYSLAGKTVQVGTEKMLVSASTPGSTGINKALATAGATAADNNGSTVYPPNAIDGLAGEWAPYWDYMMMPGETSCWLSVTFAASTSVSMVRICNYLPGYNLAPLVDFVVQYWTGSAWAAALTVTGNSSRIYVGYPASAITTTALRLYITKTRNYDGTITDSTTLRVALVQEFEAWTAETPPSLTVTRGYGGTTAATHTVGDSVAEQAAYQSVVSLVGSVPNTAGALNGCIIEHKPVSYWLNRIAFEFRSLFKYHLDSPQLVYRPDTLTSSKTITLAMTRNYSRKKSDYDNIINTINLRYGRDWSNTAAEPYTQISAVSDAASQAAYGTREKIDQFRFDFVTGTSLADNAAAWYLAHYKTRRWLVEIELFLDNIELEFGDAVTLAAFGSAVGTVLEARLRPGTETEPDGITLTVEV